MHTKNLTFRSLRNQDPADQNGIPVYKQLMTVPIDSPGSTVPGIRPRTILQEQYYGKYCLRRHLQVSSALGAVTGQTGHTWQRCPRHDHRVRRRKSDSCGHFLLGLSSLMQPKHRFVERSSFQAPATKEQYYVN